MANELFDKGVQVRRDLFGAELGEKHIKEATDFTRKFQDVVTRYCFAELWGSDAVPRRVRSIITLSMLVAMGKSNEVKLHVRAALANGVSKSEIHEILLHAMVYCGVPAAVEGFRCAREVFAELGVSESD
jgi:4-carboxymuconolactone decarboxylase